MAKKFSLALITLFLVWLIINYSLQIAKLWQSGKRIEEKKEELSLIEEKNRVLKETLEKVQSTEFIEKEAREKLGMSKEGERVIVMPPILDNQINIYGENEPSWRKWWRLLIYPPSQKTTVVKP